MCGIFGYYDRSKTELPVSILNSMGDAIRYRGPDDQGIFKLPGIAAGNQRLSIIDVAGGHQPFVSENGQIAVVQNGEIFNHLELAQDLAKAGYPCRSNSDTEVLLRLYEKEGINFIHKLNGMFAIAIYDGREDALYLIRDRIGVKPLYIYDDGQRLLYGSEIKSILQADIKPEMNPVALHHYLSFNYIPAPYTLYSGINHLMPGHYLKITKNKKEVIQWWNLANIQPIHGRNESQWIEEFNGILDDAVRLRLRCDVPFGAFLSGGVDSSTVVGLMAKHMNAPVKTFCIGFHDKNYDESSFAQEASDRFNTSHIMERVEQDMLSLWPLATYHCDQPHGDISFLPTYRVSQLAAKHVKVVLTGDGGDELFAGYDKYKSFFSQPEISAMDDEAFQKAYFSSISLFSEEEKYSLYTADFKNEALKNNSFNVAKPYFEAVKHQDRINQALYMDMQLLLSGNNLVKPDRMGMAVSLEARTPFLDYRMMEFAFRMPGYLKLKDGETKYLYKKAVAPLIGNNLAYRKKQMFTVPVGEWLKTTHANYAREHIKKLLTSNVGLNSSCNDMVEQHIGGSKNLTREIRALIAVSHWLDMKGKYA